MAFPADDCLAILDLAGLCDACRFTPSAGDVLLGEAPVALKVGDLWAGLSRLGVLVGLRSTSPSRTVLDGLPAEGGLPTLDLAEPCPGLLSRFAEVGVACF